MIVKASAKRLIRRSKGKPKAANSISFQPAPRPRTRRPPLISSTVAAILASIAGAWNAVAATSGPSVIRRRRRGEAGQHRPRLPGAAGAVVAGAAVEEVVAVPERVEAELLGPERHRAQIGPAGLPLHLGQLDTDLQGSSGHRDLLRRIVGHPAGRAIRP